MGGSKHDSIFNNVLVFIVNTNLVKQTDMTEQYRKTTLTCLLKFVKVKS